MTLTPRNRRDLADLLELLAATLETSIASVTIPGAGGVVQRGYRGQARRDRRNWRRTQDWAIRLGGGK